MDIRLRLLDRIVMPPIMKVRAENEEHHPILMEYRHSVRVLLNQYPALTLCEHLQIIYLSGLDRESLQLNFNFTWGIDESKQHSD